MRIEQDLESNTGSSEITVMELNSFSNSGSNNPTVHSRQDTDSILVYAGVGVAVVAVS